MFLTKFNIFIISRLNKYNQGILLCAYLRTKDKWIHVDMMKGWVYKNV